MSSKMLWCPFAITKNFFLSYSADIFSKAGLSDFEDHPQKIVEYATEEFGHMEYFKMKREQLMFHMNEIREKIKRQDFDAHEAIEQLPDDIEHYVFVIQETTSDSKV